MSDVVGCKAPHEARGWFGWLMPDDNARIRVDGREEAMVVLVVDM